MEHNNQYLHDCSIEKPIELSIIDYIEHSHPEYSCPNALVTADFIKLIDMAMERVTFPDTSADDTPDSWEEITEGEAGAILQSLSPEIISHPLTYETIHIVIDVYNDLISRKHLEETVDRECSRAWEFTNRANARAALGRSLEALRDYNRACEIDPRDPDHFFNRSQFLLGLGAKADALADAMHACEMMQKKGIDQLHVFLQLTSIYVECGEMNLALKALEDFIRVLRSLIPHLLKDGHGVCRAEINKNGTHMICAVDCKTVLSLVQEIEQTLDDDTRLKATLEDIKRNISFVQMAMDSL